MDNTRFLDNKGKKSLKNTTIKKVKFIRVAVF